MQPDPALAAASHDTSLTDYVAGFVVATRANDIPADVMHLGKRSVIDALGLALAGAASQTSAITRRYLARLGIESSNGSTVIGSDLRLPARFAAFANGVSIHADDYDDTQLAIAKDRVYGLLTHPTARPAQRSRSADGVSGWRRGRMQDCGGDPAASLPARISQHCDVRRDRRRGRGREAALA